jgi:hypothetical protein
MFQAELSQRAHRVPQQKYAVSRIWGSALPFNYIRREALHLERPGGCEATDPGPYNQNSQGLAPLIGRIIGLRRSPLKEVRCRQASNPLA